MRRSLPALCLLLLFAAGIAGTIDHAWPRARGFVEIQRGTMEFYDFRLFNGVVIDRREGEPLYQTDQRSYFEPGSAVYKYPPPYAALLSFDADRRWRPVAKRFLSYDATALLLTWLLFVWGAFSQGRRGDPWWEPSGPAGRSLGLLALLVLWKPFWESLAGIQLEPLFLPLFALAILGLERGWHWIEGAAVGASAVLKVYPALLGAGVVAERRWGSVLAGSIVGLGLLVFGALRFSWEETWFYFFEILPNLGGTSLALENLSVLGQISHLVVGTGADIERSVNLLPTLETTGTPLEVWISRTLAILIIGALLTVTWRTLSRISREHRGPLRLALSLPLLLLTLPTSWFDYQTLLFVPTAWLFVRLPFRRRFLPVWGIFAFALVPLLLFDANDLAKGEATPVWLSAGRTLACLGLWAALVLAGRAALGQDSGERDERLDEPFWVDGTRLGSADQI